MSKFTPIKNELLELADEIDAQTEQLMALKRRSTALIRQLQQLEIETQAKPAIAPECSGGTPWPETKAVATTKSKFMRAKDIATEYPIGESTWWKRVKSGDAPAKAEQLHLSGTVWRREDVERYFEK